MLVLYDIESEESSEVTGTLSSVVTQAWKRVLAQESGVEESSTGVFRVCQRVDPSIS